jgi:mitogen-activated protein kinase organizer 1
MSKPDSGESAVSLRHTLTPHKGPVHVARLNSLGKYLLTAGADRQIHLFNITTATTPEVIKSYSAHSGAVLGLNIASDNGTFVSGGEDRNVLQWDVGTGSILRRFSAHSGAVQVVQYCGAQGNPNDVLLTAGYDSILRFYDLRARGAWKPIMECKDAKDSILCAAARESSIWTGSVDGVVRTYDMRAGQLQQDTMDRECLKGGFISPCQGVTDCEHLLLHRRRYFYHTHSHCFFATRLIARSPRTN